ncbi:hypothetical protein L7F22_003003 [Adiantum nelumboides]|jgi:AP-2 complex subunit beta-1|nr:hypothetical protein [Adiantum nelumboides]
MADTGKDAKLFQRGKVQELRAELLSDKKDKGWVRRKTVLKKIIANATLGNDMSPLFADVVACMNIQVLEIKKMVYLYLINYGRSKPDLVPEAIPGFLSDCNDRNPLIRALAIRTMSYIPVPAVLQALIDPLRHSLKDSDPYVRKTAAICVAKLYMHDHKLVDRQGFIGMLRDLLADGNPTVVANAVAALVEISERSDNIQLKLNLTVASKLVSALPDCSEWGQTYILESLMFFVPKDYADAEILAERIAIRLQHANSAVVLTATKVILYLMNYIASAEFRESLCKKLSPPLVTLLSSGPEVQYVALRNILLVIQRRPIVLQNEVKIFFCKYNDPVYVKMAKLEIMYRLANERNVEQVLAELREYATEVDVDFVRKAVRSIGRLAIKIESAADRCISTLLTLIQTKVNYVVQEAIVVIKDIFRKYPNRYESVIATLCENLDSLDEPEAKAAMIWIIGQYADRIENSDELLEDFLYTFLEEPVEVQLALLTATVKLFLKRPTVGGELVPKVLKWATEEVDNPDCRDRGFIYWRLLSTDPAAARKIVLADKPAISTETDRMDRQLLDQLLLHGATLASIFHRQPQTFIRGTKARYIPDSPALDESARRHASSHIYSRPLARTPYSGTTASTGDVNGHAKVSGKAAPSSSPAIGGQSELERETDDVDADDDQDAEKPINGKENDQAEEEDNDGKKEPITTINESLDGVDPYSMLGDDFGGAASGYTADAPKPNSSGMNALLA